MRDLNFRTIKGNSCADCKYLADIHTHTDNVWYIFWGCIHEENKGREITFYVQEENASYRVCDGWEKGHGPRKEIDRKKESA